jgi:phage-related protein
MDQFLDEHPRIERELWRHPSLVNNAEYLQAHPALQAFLERHPNAKQEIVQNRAMPSAREIEP